MNLDLRPYPGLPAPGGVRLVASARREGSWLHLGWQLDDPTGQIALPPPEPPQRRFGLWEATCFEAFLAGPDGPGYWEFNLSPAGHWNLYRFDGYRAGMTDEQAIGSLRCEVDGQAASASLDTADLALGAGPWRLALTAVLAEHAGRQTFWAHLHVGAEPDFHHRDAFFPF